MKTKFQRLALALPLALALLLNFSTVAKAQTAGNAPAINFQNVPISTAIRILAESADVNYIMDPKLFQNADGFGKPEPALTLHWTNCPAMEALARVLKEHDLVLVSNSFTTVICITDTNHVANVVDTSLLGTDTNDVLPMIRFSDVPLDLAITELSKKLSTKVSVNLRHSGVASPAAPGFRMATVPTVSVRWQNLTARQAIAELCDVYGLEIVKGSDPSTVQIKRRK